MADPRVPDLAPVSVLNDGFDHRQFSLQCHEVLGGLGLVVLFVIVAPFVLQELESGSEEALRDHRILDFVEAQVEHSIDYL